MPLLFALELNANKKKHLPEHPSLQLQEEEEALVYSLLGSRFEQEL
jgi:hypothetical protein